VTAARASIRRAVRIRRDPDVVWSWVGAPERVHEWWPGISSCTVDGDSRTITMGSGLPMPERLLTIDAIQRRFQYRITGPLFREHTSTIDVHDLGDGTSLAVYSVDAEPSTMALVIGGAGGSALEHLRDLLEGEGR
jgi:carbon monoxide dehydrogenase subunit G